MKHFLFLLFIILNHSVWAQTPLPNHALIDSIEFSEPEPKVNNTGEKIYVFADDRELFINFPGGNKALHKFIRKNIQVKRTDTFTGNRKAVVFFTVDEEGQISNISVNEDLDPRIKEKAMSMMSKMPTWKWDIKDKSRRIKVRKVIRFTILHP